MSLRADVYCKKICCRFLSYGMSMLIYGLSPCRGIAGSEGYAFTILIVRYHNAKLFFKETNFGVTSTLSTKSHPQLPSQASPLQI